LKTKHDKYKQIFTEKTKHPLSLNVVLRIMLLWHCIIQ
jgi:hypothetical protein